MMARVKSTTTEGTKKAQSFAERIRMHYSEDPCVSSRKLCAIGVSSLNDIDLRAEIYPCGPLGVLEKEKHELIGDSSPSLVIRIVGKINMATN
jgi:hypothetical protein